MLPFMLVAAVSIIKKTEVSHSIERHMFNATKGDTWEIVSNIKSTIYVIIHSPNREMKLTREQEITVLNYDKSTAFNIVNEENSSLIFDDMCEGSYEIVTVGLGERCRSHLFISSYNWPMKENQVTDCGRSSCFIFAANELKSLSFQFEVEGELNVTISESQGINATIDRFNYVNLSTKFLIDYEFQNKTSPKLIFVESVNNLTKFNVGNYGIRNDLFIVDSDFPTGFDLDYRNLPVPTAPPPTVDLVGSVAIGLIPVYVLGYGLLVSLCFCFVQSYFHDCIF